MSYFKYKIQFCKDIPKTPIYFSIIQLIKEENSVLFKLGNSLEYNIYGKNLISEINEFTIDNHSIHMEINDLDENSYILSIFTSNFIETSIYEKNESNYKCIANIAYFKDFSIFEENFLKYKNEIKLSKSENNFVLFGTSKISGIIDTAISKGQYLKSKTIDSSKGKCFIEISTKEFLKLIINSLMLDVVKFNIENGFSYKANIQSIVSTNGKSLFNLIYNFILKNIDDITFNDLKNTTLEEIQIKIT